MYFGVFEDGTQKLRSNEAGIIFRVANVVGPSSNHGVIVDFVKKLCASDGKFLNIFGDGTQNKSYLYIDDLIEALLIGMDDLNSLFEIFNVGSEDQINVNSSAQIICHELGLEKVDLRYLTEWEDGKGWPGDVKNMLLSGDKLKTHGWKINYFSAESVSVTTKEVIEYYKKI